jgi:thiol-disulfide isomerase/thioredoxin
VSTRAQGINFVPKANSWESVIRQAKIKNKPIFVDVYTTWCGPCKHMQKYVFTDPTVGTFYNKSFISVMIDAEKGFGVRFATDHQIRAYPTLLFFSPDGQLILGGVGSAPVKGFIALGKDAVKNWKDGISLQDFEKKYANNKQNKKFLKDYIQKLHSELMPTSLIMEQYLKTLSPDSLYTQSTFRLVNSSYDSKINTNDLAFKVLLHAYKKLPVKDNYLMSPWNAIRNRLLEQIDSAGAHKDTLWLTNIIRANNKMDTIQTIKTRDDAFLICLYKAASKDSLNFLRNTRWFAYKYILHINADSLYRSDVQQYRNALLMRFGIPIKASIKENKKAKKYAKYFNSGSKIINDELTAILWYSNRYLTYHDTNVLNEFKNWQNKVRNIYSNNPVFVWPDILKN